MATTITTVSNPRPVKIFAYLLVFIAVFFLIVAAASSNWAYSEGYREGLFERCVYAGSATPLPFGMPAICAMGEQMTGIDGFVKGKCKSYVIRMDNEACN